MINNYTEHKAAYPNLADEVLKITALLYFYEALVDEEFEEAIDILDSAREFGANEKEVQGIIIEALRTINEDEVITQAVGYANRINRYAV